VSRNLDTALSAFLEPEQVVRYVIGHRVDSSGHVEFYFFESDFCSARRSNKVQGGLVLIAY